MLTKNGKSAHTALAVKACLLGGNSNTKCSMTFVNIAVAISALAGGGVRSTLGGYIASQEAMDQY